MEFNEYKIKQFFYVLIQSFFLFQILVYVVELFHPYLPNFGYSVSKEVRHQILFEAGLFNQRMQYIFYAFSASFALIYTSSFFIKRLKKHFLRIMPLFISLFSFFFAYQSTRGHSWYFGVSHRVYTMDSVRILGFYLLLFFVFYKYRNKFLK